MEMKKGLSFHARLGFALRGLRVAAVHEASFRIQLVAAVVAMLATAWIRPGWLWAALIAVAVGLVLALELVNTALEHALDGLHPDQASFVAVAKDCAAAAVLMSSALAVVLFAFMLLDTWPRWVHFSYS
ncbi:MAG: diacylglycerol kinase [Rhodocyclaceae bacterium]|jgi:diacylglycerol kinase (ATP)|nr:diacylglycerol kinase [Rhodocyclaceae bacterium]